MLDVSPSEQLTFQQQQQVGASNATQGGLKVKHDGGTAPRLIIDHSFANLHNQQPPH